MRVLKQLPSVRSGVSSLVSFVGFESRASWLLIEDLPIDRKPAEDEPEVEL